jgi:hypothetical protein
VSNWACIASCVLLLAAAEEKRSLKLLYDVTILLKVLNLLLLMGQLKGQTGLQTPVDSEE